MPGTSKGAAKRERLDDGTLGDSLVETDAFGVDPDLQTELPEAKDQALGHLVALLRFDLSPADRIRCAQAILRYQPEVVGVGDTDAQRAAELEEWFEEAREALTRSGDEDAEDSGQEAERPHPGPQLVPEAATS